MRTYYHVTPQENMASIRAEGLIPQVGERSKKLSEPPSVFLFPTIEDMETALGSWLGEEFEDYEEELVSLKISLPANFLLEPPEVNWERVSRITIPPEYIEFFRSEG